MKKQIKKLTIQLYFMAIVILFIGVGINHIEPKAIAYSTEPKPYPVIFDIQYDWTEKKINEVIDEKAKEYGVKASVMKATIACESQGSTTVQSYYHSNGKRELSFGLSQIHLPDHPNITKEQAQDPMFAIEFMAKEMSEGRAWKWTCWRNKYGN